MGGESSDYSQPVYIEARPLRSHILNGVVHSKFPVLVDVRVKPIEKKKDTTSSASATTTTTTTTTTPRPAFELSIVLDRSGSMSGEKLEKCKIAINHILDNLTANDIVHFIVYDDTVKTVFANGDISQRDLLKLLVHQVVVGGCTNLHGGLVRGYDVMLEPKDNINKNSGGGPASTGQQQQPLSKRIFLFSDGLANEGVTDHQLIFEKAGVIHNSGINISTFGVGTDFDEKLMKGIAEYGCGDYMYIEQSQDIEKKVAKALHGLVSMVGTAGLIQFRGLNSSLVERIHGNNDECLRTGVTVRELRENDWKRLVLFMEVRPPGDSKLCDILSYKLTFKETQSEQSVTLEGRVAVEFSDDESKCNTEDPLVAAAVAVTETAALDRQVLEQLELGNKEEAVRLKKRAVQLLQEKSIKGDVSDAMRDRAQLTLQKLESEISLEHARKEVGWDVYAEEECDDMGYCLFD